MVQRVKTQTALQEGGLFGLTQVCVRAPFRSDCHPKQSSRPSRWEVGSGRRERSSTNRLCILGVILPPEEYMSIA